MVGQTEGTNTQTDSRRNEQTDRQTFIHRQSLTFQMHLISEGLCNLLTPNGAETQAKTDSGQA